MRSCRTASLYKCLAEGLVKSVLRRFIVLGYNFVNTIHMLEIGMYHSNNQAYVARGIRFQEASLSRGYRVVIEFKFTLQRCLRSDVLQNSS